MKSLTILTFSLILAVQAFAQMQSVLIDFGSNGSAFPWNNVSNASSGQVGELINAYGIPTEISLEVFDAFNGINTNGTTSPAMALGIPGTASGDSFYGNTAEWGGQTQPTAGIQLTHLNPNTTYHLTIFASRMSVNDNRETQYILTGASVDTAYLNASNNTSQAVEFEMFPKSDGTLTLMASAGPNNSNAYRFYYLNCLILDFEDDTPVDQRLILKQPNGGEFWQAFKTVEINWESTVQAAHLLEYSVDNGESWKEIVTIEEIVRTYNWQIPDQTSDQCLIRITADTLSDASNTVFTISQSQESCPIVVIGSSTAEGTGASTPDSSWVGLYRGEVSENDTRFPVINLARGGYTTYHLLPDDSTLGESVNIAVDKQRNISQALDYDPGAVIINLPSNDASRLFPVEDQMRNFRLMAEEAAKEGVAVYVCTTQPRNFTNPDQIGIQLAARDSIFDQFGAYAIDFWHGIAAENGFILPAYDSGDGVHLNDKGHALLYAKVLNHIELDSLCDLSSMGHQEVAPELPVDIRVFPNPTREAFKLLVQAPDKYRINVQLIDVLGRKIAFSQHLQSDRSGLLIEIEPQIPAGQQAGLYFIQLHLQYQDQQVERWHPVLISG
jgi:lysophospholipase L1-like esterase